MCDIKHNNQNKDGGIHGKAQAEVARTPNHTFPVFVSIIETRSEAI